MIARIIVGFDAAQLQDLECVRERKAKGLRKPAAPVRSGQGGHARRLHVPWRGFNGVG
jgi:hypothetical protein